MMRFRLLAGLAALVMTPALLSAQGASKKAVTFGVSGGLSLPVGDLSDGASSGYMVAGHIWYTPSTIKLLRFRGDVAYDSWDAKGSGSANINQRSLAFVANGIYDLNSKSNVRPYLLGGGGLYNTELPFLALASSDTNLGIQFGGGLTFALAGFETFAELKYVNVFSDRRASWIPLTFGIRF
jgi:hypothetical protein